MTTIETERKKMPEDKDLEVKQGEGGISTEEKAVSVEEFPQKSRRPLWAELDDRENHPGERAVTQRHAFLKELQEDVTRAKVSQEVQRRLKAAQEQRQKRKQQRLQEQEQQTPQNVQEASEVPPWLERERARLREEYARENIEAGERMRQRVEDRQTAKREDFLSTWRLNIANRERPIREYYARDAAEREAAKGLWTPNPEEPQQEPQPRKSLLRRYSGFLKRSAGFLRGVATSAFIGIGERLEPRPHTSNRPARGTGTPAPGPGLNSLK